MADWGFGGLVCSNFGNGDDCQRKRYDREQEDALGKRVSKPSVLTGDLENVGAVALDLHGHLAAA